MIEERVIAEPRHFQHRLDQRPLAVPFDAAIGRLRQQAHGAVKRGRGAAIELEFRATQALTLGQRRVVEEGQLQRALHLEDAVADQKHDRDVRIDAARRFVRQAEARAARQEIDGVRLIVGHGPAQSPVYGAIRPRA